MNFRLSDKQWGIIEPAVTRNRLETRGRKRLSNRKILESIFTVIQSGISWRRLPKGEGHPSFQSCHRRFLEWSDNGILDNVIEILAKDMEKRAGVLLRNCFYDELYVAIKSHSSLVIINDLEYNYIKTNFTWDKRTQHFFESAWTWKFLLLTHSEWILERLPNDLIYRSNCSEFQPIL